MKGEVVALKCKTSYTQFDQWPYSSEWDAVGTSSVISECAHVLGSGGCWDRSTTNTGLPPRRPMFMSHLKPKVSVLLFLLHYVCEITYLCYKLTLTQTMALF